MKPGTELTIRKDCIYKYGTFKNDDKDSTEEEKFTAIYAFIHLTTINHVTKEQLRNALAYMWENFVEEVEDEEIRTETNQRP